MNVALFFKSLHVFTPWLCGNLLYKNVAREVYSVGEKSRTATIIWDVINMISNINYFILYDSLNF